MGKDIVKVVPFPDSVSKEIDPPIASRFLLVAARARP
jgi:hypothetical protein